ncbi:MAG TPA: hypothetical protein VJ744_08210 [Gaiellaceae bacterium]|nr:hypothetical protein [Gaiellaceae bacterium]
MTATRILVAIAAVAALGFYVGPYHDKEQDEERLAKIASVIAGRDVDIACPGTLATLTEVSAHDGSVVFTSDGRPTDEAKLSSRTCSRLRALLSGEIAGVDCVTSGPTCPKAVEDAAVAVNVLSHEAWHLAGERNESVAQCYALQSNEDTAIRLGATPAEALAIADFVVRRVQPVLPPEYKTTECRDGGPLDLDPARTGWP